MLITVSLNLDAICLLEHLGIDPNKLDTNSNLVSSYYKIKHGKQYAFITDQYCIRCIYYYNKFESATNEDIREHINNFTYHEINTHQL